MAHVHLGNDYGFLFITRAAPPMLSMWPCNSIFQIQYFSTSAIKLKLGTAKGRRLLIATKLDQPNHLANQQQVLGYVVAPFACLTVMYKNTGHKAFCWAKPTCFDYSSSPVYCMVHQWKCYKSFKRLLSYSKTNYGKGCQIKPTSKNYCGVISWGMAITICFGSNSFKEA